MIAHAAVGCVAGEFKNDECASGAAGAVIGELTGEFLQKSIEKSIAQELADDEITYEEARRMYEDMQAEGVNIARLT